MIYVGMSEDPQRRLAEHNSGKVRSTKAHLPWVLFFTEQAVDSATARTKEKFYKSSTGKRSLRNFLNKSKLS
jgi:putative endonuclease